MEKKLIYRKLEYKNKIYYQLYRIVDNEEKIDIVNDKPGKDIDEFCVSDIEFENEVQSKELLYTYYEYRESDDDIFILDDPFLIGELGDKFYQKFKDFEIVPENDFEVEKIKDVFKNDIYYQEEPVQEILNVIKSNLDIMDLDMSEEKKRKLKHNIILYGPEGFGKTNFAKSILENTPVPCTIINLATDPIRNVNLVIAGLVTSAFGNMKKAENGIVFINDNFDELDEILEDGIESYDILYELLNSKNAKLGSESGRNSFDLTKITFVLIKNTPCNSIDSLYDEGIDSRLIDKFDTFVCFKRLTKEQIKEIILNHPCSILNIYKEVCNKKGKEIVIEPDFIDTLIDRSYYDIGGLDLINQYLETMIKINWNNEKIILNKELATRIVEDSNYLKDWIDNEKDDSLLEEDSSELINNDGEKQEVAEFKIDLDKLREDYRTKLLNIMQYVKGQDEPLKNILYYTLINDIIQNSNLPMDRKKERINHMLIRGGTGSGKSYITNMIARAFDKPFAEIDCKRYTEAGYVGKSVDDMLIKLYYAAGCDLKKAQKGILFLDEIDKLARGGGDSANVSRGAVQESLLKLMEGTVFDLEIKDGHGTKIVDFDTRELTIIGAGAFEGLNKIRDSRIKNGNKKQTIGFQTVSTSEEKIDKNYTLSDMQEFGLDAQLLRRMPFQCDLNELKKEDYRNIMLNSKSSSFKIKQDRLEMLGVSLSYDEEFIEEFTNKVVKLGFGVSGISVLTERIFAFFETKLLEKDYDQVILNKECVNDPSKVILIEKKEKVYKKQI